MKFYELVRSDTEYRADRLELSEDGEWASREEAEQAARDAVIMARLLQQAIYELNDGKAVHMRCPGYVEAQAIIERYEGGKG